MKRDAPHVFVSAGEASGDEHAARVLAALRDRCPEARLTGLGGSRMRAAGVRLLAELDDLAVMGVSEIAGRLPRLVAIRRAVRRHLRDDPPDLVIPVDYPGFNLPLATFASRIGARVLYFIAPQVWAWRRRRAVRLARDCDAVAVILPFEKGFLARWGVDATFVGHPLLDREREPSSPGSMAKPGDRPRLGLFPGSRHQEVLRLLEPFSEAARRLQHAYPELEVVVARSPDLPAAAYAPCPYPLVPAADAVRDSTVALTKSGTTTLELAIGGVPMVVGHAVAPLTYAAARRLVKLPWISLVNLVADRPVVPELIQAELEPAAAAAEVSRLLAGGGDAQRADLAAVVERLGTPGCAERVAALAHQLLGRA